MRLLRQKAADANPDEFCFSMYSSKTHDRGQKLADRGNRSLSHDAVRLLKTQDAGYIKTIAQQTRRAREKLEKAFVLRDDKGVEVRGRKHGEGEGLKTVFMDDKFEQKNFDIAAPTSREASSNEVGDLFDEEGAKRDLPKKSPATLKAKSRRFIEAEENTLKQARVLRKRRKRDEETQGSKLKALESRERDLLAAERELELQRAKMSHSVGGVNKAGVKWKIRQRKR